MKVNLSEEIKKVFPERSSSNRWNLAQDFQNQHPEIEFVLEGDKRPRRFLTNQQDVDTLRGFLSAKGGTASTALVPLPATAKNKEMVASLVRSVKQLRAAGYDISLSVREPAKEY